MNKEMAGDASSNIEPGRSSSPKREIRLPLWKKVGMTVAAAAGLVGVGSACEVKTPRPSPTPYREIPTQTWTPTESPTTAATATETKAITPTEIPLFTEAQVEAASPFDDSTWPDRFKNTQLHPELATEQAWQDEYQFLLAVRENKGIPKTAEYKTHINPELQSLWNGIEWMQNNPDKIKAEQLKLIISPVEYRAMIEEQRKIGGLDSLPPKDLQGWNSKFIGPILGREDIDAERHPFDEISGKLAGFGIIGGQDVVLLDIRDTDGYHVLFPVVVYVENGPTLPKGSKCLVGDMNYSDKHGGNSSYVLPQDMELDPLRSIGNGKIVSWEDLYDGPGKTVIIDGGYGRQVEDKTGISAIKCFSPVLNLEIASAIKITTQDVSSSPWKE
jgi:hypothetical protein